MEIYAISQQKNQKSKRRERAQRMQAEKDIDIVGGGEVDSGEDDDYETLKRDKTVRPPVRRKRSKDSSPILEEDIIDGFAILAFKSYEDLEFATTLASKRNEKRLSSIVELTELMAEEKPEKQQGKSKSESKSKSLPDESYQKNQAKAYINQSVYAHQDAGTSDDSGRASERLTASSVAQRDAESSRDRLSDASSRCSSGKGYICDSEGDDDKASETGSIVFSNAIGKHNTQNCSKRDDASNDISNYREPIKDEQMHNNESNNTMEVTNAAQMGKPTGNAVPTLETTIQNCVPNSTSHILLHDNVGDKLNRSSPSGATGDPEDSQMHEEKRPQTSSNVNTENTNNIAAPHNELGQQEPFNFKTEITKTSPLRSPSKVFSVPSVPSHIVSSQSYNHNEQKPEIFSSLSSSSSTAHPPYRATYAGFSTFTPYSCTTLSSPDMSQKPNRIHELVQGKPVQDPIEQTENLNNTVHIKSGSPGINKLKSVSPRISSPFKDRDCYSESGASSANNVPGTSKPSNLHTDTSVSTTNSLTQPKVISAASWSQMSTQEQTFLKVSPSVGPPRPTPPPTITSGASIITQPPASASHPTPTTTAPLSFSAESLFSSSKSKDQTDMLRRELDTRFLTSAGPYLRQELHHHQHQHTHLHQHHQQIISAVPPTSGSIFPPPLFKEIPKIGGVDSPFYRTGMGMPMYPGYPPTLLHPNMGTATQFVPPTHLAGYMQKKPGRWNAIHVRIAWEIYYHQSKQNPDRSGHIKATDMLRPPTHVHPPAGNIMRGHELVQGSYTSSTSVLGGRSVFESGIPTSYLGASSHMGLSPFSRYSAPFASYNSISPYARDPALGGGGYPALHDPWRSLQRGYLPSSAPSASWAHKPDPGLEISKRENEERERQLREREERERQRREREEKERQKEREREREEKLKKEQQERERKEKEKREFERREMERERMLQQQRMNESCKASAALMHDARGNVLRNGIETDIRIKEENRKEEELMARDVRYVSPSTSLLNPPPHTYLASKHPSHLLPGPHLSRSLGMPPTGPPMSHFPPPPNVWPGIDPYRDYRLEAMAPLRYNIPLMEAFRAEEERAKAYAHNIHYRQKEAQPFPMLHHRMPSNPIKPPNSALLPSVNLDGHKKEDPSPSR